MNEFEAAFIKENARIDAERAQQQAQAGTVQQQTPPKNQPAENTTQSPKKIYSHHSFADFCKTPTPIKYLVKGYVQEQALHMYFGEPACGKSFTVLDIAASIACEDIYTWHGITLKHGAVVYLAGEGATGLRKRCAGWAAKNEVNPDTVQLEIIDEVFHLDDTTEDYNIDSTIANIKTIYENPALIVIDTVHVFMSGDENKAVDVAAMLSACRKLIRELGCAVLLIHHVGVDQSAKGRARGSSSFRGAMDIEIQVTKNERLITLTQKKNKDNEIEKPLVFTLSQVTVPEWLDDEGTPVTTCIIELNQTRTEAAASQKKEREQISASEKRARETYTEAMKKYGRRIIDEETGHELAAVDIEDWRKILYANSSADNDDTKRTQFNRGRQKLFEEKKILRKNIIDGQEYYCLDLTENSGDTFTVAVDIAIKERERQHPRAAQHAGGQRGGNHDRDGGQTTGDLF